jgi:DNA-directed RNA polymerase III subunit RPC3
LTFALRNQSLAREVERTFGRLTAQVARAAAKQIDLHLHSVNTISPNDSPETPQKLDIDQILEDVRIDDEHPLRNTRPSTNGWPEHRPVNGFHTSNGNGMHDREDIIRHLGILAEGPFSFFEYSPILEAWFVHKRKLSLFLRDQELMRLAADGIRLNDPKLRIMRMLSDKGKLDEKNLQEIGLLNAKELRQSLAALQSAGLLELQEVPREPQRQPNRTIFLWFYDCERVQKLYLNKLYKSMSRLFQRLEVERSRLATTLTKIERTDVQGIEEDMLSAAELKVLSQWRQREAWFIAEISRIDDSVSILRDL